MIVNRIRYLLSLLAVIVAAGCGADEWSAARTNSRVADLNSNSDAAKKPQKIAKPVPPLKLREPPAPPSRFLRNDLKTMEAAELEYLAREAAGEKRYSMAAMAQYWHVQKSGEGQYDLACYLAQSGQASAAFYWLQKAAIEEGVEAYHAQHDGDLRSLHADKRWKPVLNYMQECQFYFATTDITKTSLILPLGYKKETPITAIVWMHGYGSRPDDFVDASNGYSQYYANTMNVALIGVSGTIPRGPRSFVWADESEKNADRVRSALAEVSDRVTIAPGKVITFGFSQGAQAGLEVAVRYPKEFAGSIVLSPGASTSLEDLEPTPLLAKRGFVVSIGANEHFGFVRLAKDDADWLRNQAKARVKYLPYPDVSEHTFPADFDQRFPEWVEFVLGAK